MEDMLTTAPPLGWRIISLVTSCISWNGAKKFTSKPSRNSDSAISSNALRQSVEALLTTPSRRPKTPAARATSPDASCNRSAVTAAATDSPPSSRTSRFAAVSDWLQWITTRQPSAAKARQSTAPMRRAPPVMSTTFFKVENKENRKSRNLERLARPRAASTT